MYRLEAGLPVLSAAVVAESPQIDEDGNRIVIAQVETRIIEADHGACEVESLKLFDNGGRYRRGADGPDYVSWRPGTLDHRDGVTVRVVPGSDPTIHVKVGEWQGGFELTTGRVVDG